VDRIILNSEQITYILGALREQLADEAVFLDCVDQLERVLLQSCHAIISSEKDVADTNAVAHACELLHIRFADQATVRESLDNIWHTYSQRTGHGERMKHAESAFSRLDAKKRATEKEALETLVKDISSEEVKRAVEKKLWMLDD